MGQLTFKYCGAQNNWPPLSGPASLRLPYHKRPKKISIGIRQLQLLPIRRDGPRGNARGCQIPSGAARRKGLAPGCLLQPLERGPEGARGFLAVLKGFRGIQGFYRQFNLYFGLPRGFFRSEADLNC